MGVRLRRFVNEFVRLGLGQAVGLCRQESSPSFVAVHRSDAPLH